MPFNAIQIQLILIIKINYQSITRDLLDTYNKYKQYTFKKGNEIKGKHKR